MAEGADMTTEYVQVKVYADNGTEKLVELPGGEAGIINGEGGWVYGPLPVQWSKVMLKHTMTEWEKPTWTKTGEAFFEAA